MRRARSESQVVLIGLSLLVVGVVGATYPDPTPGEGMEDIQLPMLVIAAIAGAIIVAAAALPVIRKILASGQRGSFRGTALVSDAAARSDLGNHEISTRRPIAVWAAIIGIGLLIVLAYVAGLNIHF
jgi:hypothetical protein